MGIVGTLIDDKYEVVGQIGSGGFGSVFKAIQRSLQRPVALKFLRASMLDEPDGSARFEREAKALNGLNHKNVVALYGFGVWQKAPYMVMEYLEGTSLESIIAHKGMLSPDETVEVMRQVFEGLAAAHRAGIVHRDLKPANIMVLDVSRTVKLIDFGLAKLMPLSGVEAQRLTETGCTLGTSHYMSPEQCVGSQVDSRSDIYAAGCILFECLTGRYPFDADESIAVMYQQVNLNAPRLSTLIAKTPLTGALQVIIDNCLAKERTERYSTCDEVLADLDAALAGNFKNIKPRAKVRTKASRTMFFAGLCAIAVSLAVFGYWLTKTKQEAPNMMSSADLFEDIMRHAKNSRDYMDDQLPLLEAALAANERDHKLATEQAYKTYILAAHARLFRDPDGARQFAIRAFDLHDAVRPAQLNAVDEYVLATILCDTGQKELGKKILGDTVRYQQYFSRDGWDVTQARMRLEEMRATNGEPELAEKNILEYLKTSDAPPELAAQIYTSLAHVYMFDHKEKLALEVARKAATTPQRYPALPYFAALRANCYTGNWKEADKYAELTDRQRGAEHERRPCRSLMLLHLAAAARIGKHDHAMQVLKHFEKETKAFPNAAIVAMGDLDERDEKLCVAALDAAHYEDIRQKLGPMLLHSSR